MGIRLFGKLPEKRSDLCLFSLTLSHRQSHLDETVFIGLDIDAVHVEKYDGRSSTGAFVTIYKRDDSV